jgi:hypothetical protein
LTRSLPPWNIPDDEDEEAASSPLVVEVIDVLDPLPVPLCVTLEISRETLPVSLSV